MCKETFILTIAPIIQRYAKERGYKVASAVIAQACLESRYGQSGLAKYYNFFGLKCGSVWKGQSVNMTTKEEYTPGQLTTIKDNFRVYSSMEEGVRGYYDFISTSRYSNLRTATTPEQYLLMIKNDGYATSSSYVANNMAVVDKYNLRQYDTLAEIKAVDYAVKITATSLMLRSSYTTASIPILPQGLPKGLRLRIVAECDGWGKVGDIDGWVCLKYTQKI